MKCTKIILGGLMAVAATVNAMPTLEQTKKVEPLVMDLMREDQNALKSGKKTRAEVAESAMALAEKAETEAAKLLLMKGAFHLYVRAGEFDRAIETLQRLQSAIPDMPLDNMVRIIESSLRVVSRKNGGQLYRLLDETKTRIRYTNETASLEKSVKRTPSDRALRLKLAEHYAYLGKWNLALESFAATDGKAGTFAKSERDGKAATEKAADFWWNYPTGKADELVKCFRAHAAKLYEEAIASGDIKGLNKVQAERRIEETKGYGDVTLQEMDESKEISFDIGSGIRIEMLSCAPGMFELEDMAMKQKCKVRIRRSYWLGKVDVTIEQWYKVMGENPILTQRQELAGGMKIPISKITYSQMEDFCNKMNSRFAMKLPSGYVFRIPTYAEWRYAAQASAKKGSEWFQVIHDGRNLSRYGIQISDIQGLVKEPTLSCWDAPLVDATIRSPNPWGFYGMIGNIERRIVLDSFDPTVQGIITHKGIDKVGRTVEVRCTFPEKAVDLFHWSDNPNRHHLALKQMGQKKDEIGIGSIGWFGVPETDRMSGFRLCLGPDLVSEWKARNKKK